MKPIAFAAALALLGSSVVMAPGHAAPFGRFLFKPDTKGSIVFSYGMPTPTEFDQQVTCGDVVCGDIKFDYDTFLMKPDGTKQGGAALVGGFYLSPGLKLAPGDKLEWVQTITATFTGTNHWGINPNKGPFEFPDAGKNSRTSPAYPNQSLPVCTHRPARTPNPAVPGFSGPAILSWKSILAGRTGPSLHRWSCGRSHAGVRYRYVSVGV